jgi:NAD(P)-dependent dehydrogenase (short-subunit alcohol dehydrogenase family)
MTLSDKGVVVTGAAGGIGKALAARLVAGGARVVLNDLDQAATEAAAAEVGGYPVHGDAASAAGVAALESAASAYLGQIDAWFGNAGIVRGHGLDASDAEWTASWEVNTMAHVRAARLLIPQWLERGGGRQVLSATYRHRGIVVQVICPQGVLTDMLAETGQMRDVLSSDAVTPQAVAETTWQALQDNRFLILPQPEAGEYYRQRATDTDRWLAGMNKLQRRLDDPAGI